MAQKSRHTTISIPLPLYKSIRQLIKGTGFTSASDFVTFVLRDVLIDVKSSESKQSIAKRKLVRDRLKALGYL
jgi:Arc/MetJ-type ribon-helix-helix transcriptional regulator